MVQNIQNELLQFNVPEGTQVFLSPGQVAEIYPLGYVEAFTDQPSLTIEGAYLCRLTASGVEALQSVLPQTEPQPSLASPPPLNPFSPEAQTEAGIGMPLIGETSVEPTVGPIVESGPEPEIDNISLSRGKPVETYPWLKIGVDQSYHVKLKPDGDKTGEELMKANLKRVRSAVNSRNALPENRVEIPGQTKTATRTINKLDASGQKIIGEDGKPVKVQEEYQKQATEQRVQYKAAPVDENDVKGVGIRIYRVK